MASRPIGSANISFGLVSIPVRLFAATRSKSVSFNLLHAKDKSRIQQKTYCPVDDALIDRSELVRGFEIEQGVYVTFTDEELTKLEAQDGHAIEIGEFVPLSAVDPVYFERSYYLGCEPASARAYRLLADAMAQSGQVAVGRYTMRGKENLVLIRPHEKGLMMHMVYYGDEVRPVEEVDRGQGAEVKSSELDLAKRLIAELAHQSFDPAKYSDRYRERVLEAAQQKVRGAEAIEAPAQARRAQVIDLMGALKASLDKRGVAPAQEGQRAAAGGSGETAGSKAGASARAARERRRAGGKR